MLARWHPLGLGRRLTTLSKAAKSTVDRDTEVSGQTFETKPSSLASGLGLVRFSALLAFDLASCHARQFGRSTTETAGQMGRGSAGTSGGAYQLMAGLHVLLLLLRVGAQVVEPDAQPSPVPDDVVEAEQDPGQGEGGAADEMEDRQAAAGCGCMFGVDGCQVQVRALWPQGGTAWENGGALPLSRWGTQHELSKKRHKKKHK